MTTRAPADLALALDLPVPALARGPFTRAQAAAAGVARARLERWLRSGAVVRVLRGVLAPATLAHDLPFRAAAVGLALGPDHVACGRTAAWLHGVDVGLFTPPGLPPSPPVPLQRRRGDAVPPGDLVVVSGVPTTSPLRTALDLARDDDEAVAVAVMDHLLRSGALTTTVLLASLAFGPHDGWVRELAVLADDRAEGPAESVLRLRWLRSRLPTPVPGAVVATREGAVRLALALPDHRFGVHLGVGSNGGSDGGSNGGSDAAGPRSLRDQGWWVVGLSAAKVLRAEPDGLRRHLEREFHQALLAQVG